LGKRWKRSSGRSLKSRSFYQYSRSLLENEKGALPVKTGALVRIALVFPNRYAVGMSNLGFQTVYRLFNEHPEVRCERIFLYEDLYENTIKSLESNARLDEFDFIGISFSFELDLLHIIHLLNRANIALLQKDRTQNDPLIFCGGAVCGLNPSPLLPYMDGLLVGEGEGIIHKISNILAFHRKRKSHRREIIESLSGLDGVLIPGLKNQVVRQKAEKAYLNPIYTPIVTPRSHFKNMFVVETGRGCGRGCLYCAACKIYSPCRYHERKRLIKIINEKNPGAERVGLEGAGLSDYPDLAGLCADLVEKGYKISFSSIRPDKLTSEMIHFLETGGARTLTLAPETGNENLRKKIGKGFSDQAVMDAVQRLSTSSVQTLKLYFMIGLPGETERDILSIITMTREIGLCFRQYQKNKTVKVSVNSFIPKPFTEFQFAGMETEKQLNMKRAIIRDKLKKEPAVYFKNKSTKEEILQAVLTLGSEKTGFYMKDAAIKNLSWKKVLKEAEDPVIKELHRERNSDDSFPWELISYETEKEILWNRYRKQFYRETAR